MVSCLGYADRVLKAIISHRFGEPATEVLPKADKSKNLRQWLYNYTFFDVFIFIINLTILFY